MKYILFAAAILFLLTIAAAALLCYGCTDIIGKYGVGLYLVPTNAPSCRAFRDSPTSLQPKRFSGILENCNGSNSKCGFFYSRLADDPHGEVTVGRHCFTPDMQTGCVHAKTYVNNILIHQWGCICGDEDLCNDDDYDDYPKKEMIPDELRDRFRGSEFSGDTNRGPYNFGDTNRGPYNYKDPYGNGLGNTTIRDRKNFATTSSTSNLLVMSGCVIANRF